ATARITHVATRDGDRLRGPRQGAGARGEGAGYRPSRDRRTRLRHAACDRRGRCSGPERGETHYTPSAGVVELREAIALYLKERRGVRVDPGQVIVTPGAKPIMFYALLALLDDGDEAIYPDPGFPIYASMIDFAGARGVPLTLREENGFQPDLDELRRLVSPRTKVLVLNSPNNPTGGVLSRDAIRSIATIARERDLWVLTDEIDGGPAYDGQHR